MRRIEPKTENHAVKRPVGALLPFTGRPIGWFQARVKISPEVFQQLGEITPPETHGKYVAGLLHKEFGGVSAQEDGCRPKSCSFTDHFASRQLVMLFSPETTENIRRVASKTPWTTHYDLISKTAAEAIEAQYAESQTRTRPIIKLEPAVESRPVVVEPAPQEKTTRLASQPLETKTPSILHSITSKLAVPEVIPKPSVAAPVFDRAAMKAAKEASLAELQAVNRIRDLIRQNASNVDKTPELEVPEIAVEAPEPVIEEPMEALSEGEQRRRALQKRREANRKVGTENNEEWSIDAGISGVGSHWRTKEDKK